MRDFGALSPQWDVAVTLFKAQGFMQKGVVVGGPKELAVEDSLKEAAFSRHSKADAHRTSWRGGQQSHDLPRLTDTGPAW